jgi:hypothetical protein
MSSPFRHFFKHVIITLLQPTEKRSNQRKRERVREEPEKMSAEVNPSEEELCLVDRSVTNSILREIKYFQTLKKKEKEIF